jgi:hypothetical protein
MKTVLSRTLSFSTFLPPPETRKALGDWTAPIIAFLATTVMVLGVVCVLLSSAP